MNYYRYCCKKMNVVQLNLDYTITVLIYTFHLALRYFPTEPLTFWWTSEIYRHVF